MNCIDRRYFESLKENPNAIWKYLDCIEKIAYHQFQDSPLIMEEVFCDDVNICLYESPSDVSLTRNTIKPKNYYFDWTVVKSPGNPLEYVKKLINEGIIVGINTYFYDIPNFTWYQNERYRESVHFCMVIGYDENGFWLKDVPGLMKVEYLNDRNFTIISYEEMARYLSKQCNIFIFREKNDTFFIRENLDELIRKMIQEYSAPLCVENEIMVWKGKNAYERLLLLIKNEDPRLLEMDFYHGDFASYIISGRHDILRRNILKKYGDNRLTQDVLKMLKVCQNEWEVLGNKILKENMKKGICVPTEGDIYNIYKLEHKLVEYLKFLVEC